MTAKKRKSNDQKTPIPSKKMKGPMDVWTGGDDTMGTPTIKPTALEILPVRPAPKTSTKPTSPQILPVRSTPKAETWRWEDYSDLKTYSRWQKKYPNFSRLKDDHRGICAQWEEMKRGWQWEDYSDLKTYSRWQKTYPNYSRLDDNKGVCWQWEVLKSEGIKEKAKQRQFAHLNLPDDGFLPRENLRKTTFYDEDGIEQTLVDAMEKLLKEVTDEKGLLREDWSAEEMKAFLEDRLQKLLLEFKWLFSGKIEKGWFSTYVFSLLLPVSYYVCYNGMAANVQRRDWEHKVGRRSNRKSAGKKITPGIGYQMTYGLTEKEAPEFETIEIFLHSPFYAGNQKLINEQTFHPKSEGQLLLMLREVVAECHAVGLLMILLGMGTLAGEVPSNNWSRWTTEQRKVHSEGVRRARHSKR